MDRSEPLLALVAVVLLAGVLPAAAAGALHDGPPAQAGNQSANESADDGVRVGTGAQLATILSTTAGEVRTEYEQTVVSVRIESSDGESRASVVADRHAELRERAERVRDEYENVTAAYRAGNLSQSEYAQRLATLNARANNVQASLSDLALAAETLSDDELAAANVTVDAIEATEGRLDEVRGPGFAAIRSQFVGQSEGEIEIETRDGVSIEVESEEGEQSREFERERDGNGTVALDREAALDAARSHLTEHDAGWSVAESELDSDDGVYQFEFVLSGPNATGEAEAAVDAGTGTVFQFEEEIEPRDVDDEGEDEPEVEREDESEDEAENETETDEDAADRPTLALDRSEAVDLARGELRDTDREWTVDSVELDRDDAIYEIAFLLGPDGDAGEAEVTVNGSTESIVEVDQDVEEDVLGGDDDSEDDSGDDS